MADDDATTDATNPHRTVVTTLSAGPKQRDTNNACLIVIYGEDLGRRVPLGRKETIIGRSSRCDVQVDQESVSRNHCRIAHNGKQFSLRDLGSTNGTYVNDELVEDINLRDGDQVKVGRTIMKFITGGNIETQYHEEIYRLMTVDGLTEIHNKRYFDEALEKETSRSARYDRCFTLIIFDIDHFKDINDTHGHLAGDAVLRQLASVVRKSVRRDDVLARVGGEEFAVILPEISCERGAAVAEKIRAAVEATKFDFEGTDITVTVSLGVAQWEDGVKDGPDLVRLADDMLYKAKRSGRNKVCS